MTNSESLHVHWGKELVGRVWAEEGGAVRFQYAEEWMSATASRISLQLPIQKEPFSSVVSTRFFSNLLPEGNIRTRIAQKFRVSPSDIFGLLKAVGGECAGALSLLPEGEAVSEQGDYEPISRDELDLMIRRMATQPLLVWNGGLRVSLAGAQEKLAVYLQDGKIYLPRGAYPSSHILKPRGQFDFVENEAFCMTLARKCGLPVPRAFISREFASEPVYVVERFDRMKDDRGRVQRLHQEDFCQALGCDPTLKYEAHGGPGFQQCFSMLSANSTMPALDKKALLRWAVFNCLIGNCDAHAKNISMLITKKDYRLAPLYDLVSTRVYPETETALAMNIGLETISENIEREDWERLASSVGFSAREALSICREMVDEVPEKAGKLRSELAARYGAVDVLDKIFERVSDVSERFRSYLRDIKRPPRRRTRPERPKSLEKP